MTKKSKLSHILVGDHLGQVKKILLPTYEISTLSGCAEPTSSNPVVSIQPIGSKNKQLIANKNGELYIYDPVTNEANAYATVEDSIIKALPIKDDNLLLVYDKRLLTHDPAKEIVKLKREEIKDVTYHDHNIALVGKDLPLKIYDISEKKITFDAEPPEKNWLGIRPEVFVSGVNFLDDSNSRTKLVTCSKSDSVIRVYDPLSGKKAVISANLNQEAFNEHAEANRFTSITSTGHTIVVGSNVGQILAIDLRLHAKQRPKKKLQPKSHKILGSYKGARGASLKNLEIAEDQLISCCLDRYLRLHSFGSRQLCKEVYVKTKPMCSQTISFQD